ncbi:NADH-quinone oxidoreductase subunit NuoH [Nitrospirota bacterium]
MILDIVWVLIQIVLILTPLMLCVAYATWGERKVIGHMQVRMGPMRVGPHGLLQPIADGIKLFFKEDIIPSEADKPVFYIAPVIALLAAMSSMAVLPFFRGYALADINIGLLYILALSSIGAYGIILAGWASNSKFSFLGSLRSSAQVISYEVAMGLSLVGVMIQAESLNLNDIVMSQGSMPWQWNIFPQIIGAFVFFMAALAETNRSPFDLPEAESELVAGYFTEYSGFRFSIFFIAEYLGMFMMAILGATCFMGGWSGPGDHIAIVSLMWLMLKVGLFVFIYYWIRATLPRFRYDQLMDFGWKVMIPLALLNIVIIATYKVFDKYEFIGSLLKAIQ